jgi:ferredoxin-thioredoxin reductase catalytic subunit
MRDKNPDTKCMCKAFREQEESGVCHCGLYKKTVTKD